LEERGEKVREYVLAETWDLKAEKWANYFDELEAEMNGYEDDKQAVLVLGPESSGTRLGTKILTEMGFKGSDQHRQQWDDELPENQQKIVWRRSYPHDNKWPDLKTMTRRLRRRNYNVAAVVMERDMHATISSQMNHNHVDSAFQGVRQIKEAKRRIINDLRDAKVDYVPVSYENLVQRPKKAIQTLAEQLGVEYEDVNIEITDENEKHYS
ncbi:MAG: hypothetical protein ABEI54_01890, partial [Candidatus Bipolaricaulia bacterium]